MCCSIFKVIKKSESSSAPKIIGTSLHSLFVPQAKVAQLVEHDLAKVGVASSNLVFRSKPSKREGFFLWKI